MSHRSALPDLSNRCSGLKQMVKNLRTDANTKSLIWIIYGGDKSAVW